MKDQATRDKLIAQLKRTPIVQIACEKTGVSRATYYRWRKDSAAFTKAADKAIEAGSQLVNDMAESQLLSAIRDGNMTGIIFWLKHHHGSYATRVEVEARHRQLDEKLTPEQQAVVTEALRLAGISSNEGTEKTNPKDHEKETPKPK